MTDNQGDIPTDIQNRQIDRQTQTDRDSDSETETETCTEKETKS